MRPDWCRWTAGCAAAVVRLRRESSPTTAHLGSGRRVSCRSHRRVVLSQPRRRARPVPYSRTGDRLGCSAGGGHAGAEVGCGRCPAGVASPRQCVDGRQSAVDAAGHFRCGRPIGCLSSGHLRTGCRVRRRPAGVVLQELVAGLAAAGGVQPTPVGASKPGGQPAAELAADVGHRRPDKRVGLLDAEVVHLHSTDVPVAPAANDRLGDHVRVDTELCPGAMGPGAAHR
jgi:hypothetical protein